jgi:hypothetical protein
MAFCRESKEIETATREILEKGEKNLQIIPQNISWVRLNDFAV